MLKKFEKECNRILNKRNLKMESNGFSNADELLEEVFDLNSFKDFNEFKKNSDLINKIKMSSHEILDEASKGLWVDTIEKLDPEDENEKDSFEFAKQFYYFLKECM